MKNPILVIGAAAFLSAALLSGCGEKSTTETGETTAADSTGLPGDNFSLQGALDLFKNAKSLEDFEKQLNDESNKVNNLDLNGDGNIDYIRVIDHAEGNAHAIVLQAPLGENDEQDIAVIEIEKTNKDSAFLQIVGDEDLYADKGIVEPVAENNAAHRNMASFGPVAEVTVTVGIGVNVIMWPCIVYIYEPDYVVWISPWYWDYYPSYWHPWKPYPWYMHHGYCEHYMKGYNKVYKHKMNGAHSIYAPYKKSSMMTHGKYKGPNGNGKPGNMKQNGKNDNNQFGKQNNNKKDNNNFNKQNNKSPVNNKQNQQNTKSNQQNTKTNQPNNKQTQKPTQKNNSAPKQTTKGGGKKGGK